MTAPKRCALLEGHPPPCAAWSHLSDQAVPRRGTRCTHLVEPSLELWQRYITRRELADEPRRRQAIAEAREAAARFGYHGRIQLVSLGTTGPPAVDLYAIRIYPALGGTTVPRDTAARKAPA